MSAEKNILTIFSFPDSGIVQETKKVKFKKELGISIDGKYEVNGKNYSRKKLVLVKTSSGKLSGTKIIDTDEVGDFWVTGLQVYDSAEFGISTANGKKGKLILHPREVPPIPKIEHDFVMKYKEEKFRGVSIPNNSSDQTTLLREVTVKGYQLIEKPQDPIYGTPDISISKEETAKFLTVLDAILSKVSNAYVLVDQSTKLNIGIAFGSFSTKRDIAVPALVVIDGVPLPYYDLTSISPLDVERIDILKYASTAIYGFYGAGGVVLIHTKKGNEKDGRKANHNELDWKKFERLVLHGYSPTRSFAAPDYSQPEKLHEEIQDARSTIYWEPKINTTNGEASISFYSADEETKYRIVVEGMTLNGKPVRCVSFVDVKK